MSPTQISAVFCNQAQQSAQCVGIFLSSDCNSLKSFKVLSLKNFILLSFQDPGRDPRTTADLTQESTNFIVFPKLNMDYKAFNIFTLKVNSIIDDGLL